jgi:hypothetical protein
MSKKMRWVVAAVLLLPAAYVGLYYHLSRSGHAFESMSDRFYYLPPRDTAAWRAKHTACVCVFAPANMVDQFLFLGRPANRQTAFGV